MYFTILGKIVACQTNRFQVLEDWKKTDLLKYFTTIHRKLREEKTGMYSTEILDKNPAVRSG
jgi:hypothetical protein